MAQSAANKEAVRESALVNQINQVTPYGSMKWSGDIGTPERTVTQSLTPEGQQMLDLTNQAGIKYGETANQQLGSVASKLAQPIDFSGMGPAPVANEAARTAARDAIIARSQPQFDRDLDATITRLTNQGILDPASDAYKAEMNNYNRGVNDFRLAADSQAGNEMARTFGLESAARDRGINEMMQERQIPLNELAAMLSGAQVQGPQFVNPTQYNVAPADIAGMTYANYQGAQNAANMQNQSNIANMQGLYGLAGTAALGGAMSPWVGKALGWSDRRLKSAIEWLAALPNGIDLYTFRYPWDAVTHVGVMSDEIRDRIPDAVVQCGGFDMVNYAALVSA